MTTYQAERFLPQQLASILEQTRLPDEVVVYDDASTDATWEILADTAGTAPVPVRLHRQLANVGLRRNVESALATCTGDVVVLADQDDVWHPDKLATAADAFDDDTVRLWFSDAELVDADGASLSRRAWQAAHVDLAELGWRRLLHGQTVTGATMAVSAEVVRLALPLPPELDGPDHLYLHDGWLALLAACTGAVVADERCLTSYRQHDGQVTAMEMARMPAPASRDGLGDAPRQQALRQEAARVALVLDRLSARDAVVTADVRAGLHDLTRYYRVRTGADDAGPRRLQILRELARGGYHRNARGFRTAARDLARGSG